MRPHGLLLLAVTRGASRRRSSGSHGKPTESTSGAEEAVILATTPYDQRSTLYDAEVMLGVDL